MRLGYRKQVSFFFLIGLLDRLDDGRLLGSSGLLGPDEGGRLLEDSLSAVLPVAALGDDVPQLGQRVARARLDLGPLHRLLGLELDLKISGNKSNSALKNKTRVNNSSVNL